VNITQLTLRNNRTAIVLLVAIIFAGIQAYIHMPRAYDPGFTIRVAQVVTHMPGASPKRIELLISDKIEKAVQEIPELDFVTSESRTGVSIVMVNIKESYKDMRPIWDALRRKVEGIKNELPDGISGPYVNDEFGDVFGSVIAITGEGFSYRELKDVADQVRERMLRIDDVAKVEIHGEQQEHVFVEYNNARLTELNISPTQFQQILGNRNVVVSGGAIDIGNERIALEPSGNFESVKDIRETVIRLPGSGAVIYLDDIADVRRGYKDPVESIVRASGFPALVVAVSMREGGNNIKLGDSINHVLETLQPQYPHGIEFEKVNFSPSEVDKKVNDFVTNLLQAIVVVAAVMLLFLGLRTGLIITSLIPCSMIFSMWAMSMFNIGLDQISLAALIIALGMLVDNGIVMSESILVRMSNGETATQASIASALELKTPLLVSSLTTSAAFLPIFLAESAMGEFTASLFKVVTITLMCSWLLSLTLIPILCVLFMRVKQAENHGSSNFSQLYRQLLAKLIRFRWGTIATTVLCFVVAIYGLRYVPSMFFPPSDRSYFKLELELPLGTSIERTKTVISEIEAMTKAKLVVSDNQLEGITNWVSYIGYGGPRFILPYNPEPTSSNYAVMIFNTTSPDIIGELLAKLDTEIFNTFPDASYKIRRIESGPAISNPVEFRLFGDKPEALFAIADTVKHKMSEVNGLKNVVDNWGPRNRKLLVKIDQNKALRAGVTSQDIATSLQAGLSGIQLTQYREEEDIIPVVLRSNEANRQDINDLEALSVYVQANGNSIPLSQVAHIELVWESSKIYRRDRLKVVTIGAQLTEGMTATEGFDQLRPWLEEQQKNWPPGYYFELGGEHESSGKASASIGAKLPIAALFIVLLLVGQFNSIRKSLIVLTTIPLGLIGVTVGLLAFQSFFGFFTLLGIISLTGIVINNAIVLLERIQIELDIKTAKGGSALDAILEAAQTRVRPIVLTTATTVLGLLPLYLSGGEMWEPMAVSIIAGLIFSTVLTLCFVPVLYATLYGINANTKAA